MTDVHSVRTDAPARVQPLAFSVRDACSLLSISRSSLYVLAARGKVRLTKLGGKTLVSRVEIDRLLGKAV